MRLRGDPESFPEAMYVQMPDRNPGQPVLLPVVRMGCDTALVVIPPNKSRTPTVMTPTQVKATPIPRQNTVGVYVCFLETMEKKREH